MEDTRSLNDNSSAEDSNSSLEDNNGLNSTEHSKEPDAENPYKLLDLKVTPPKTWAAGLPAVMAAMRDLIEEKTFFRGNKALLKMNQFGGFDCPSCA